MTESIERDSPFRCAGHVTHAERLPYVAWHEKAAKSKNERTEKCAECGRFYFSWERRP